MIGKHACWLTEKANIEYHVLSLKGRNKAVRVAQGVLEPESLDSHVFGEMIEIRVSAFLNHRTKKRRGPLSSDWVSEAKGAMLEVERRAQTMESHIRWKWQFEADSWRYMSLKKRLKISGQPTLLLWCMMWCWWAPVKTGSYRSELDWEKKIYSIQIEAMAFIRPRRHDTMSMEPCEYWAENCDPLNISVALKWHKNMRFLPTRIVGWIITASEYFDVRQLTPHRKWECYVKYTRHL